MNFKNASQKAITTKLLGTWVPNFSQILPNIKKTKFSLNWLFWLNSWMVNLYESSYRLLVSEFEILLRIGPWLMHRKNMILGSFWTILLIKLISWFWLCMSYTGAQQYTCDGWLGITPKQCASIGNVFTRGDNRKTPGCGSCWCCKPVPTTPVPIGKNCFTST